MKAVNDAHELEYGGKPDIVAKAPGRFHLIGEHSWFFKDKTMSMAVNLPIYVAISKREYGIYASKELVRIDTYKGHHAGGTEAERLIDISIFKK